MARRNFGQGTSETEDVPGKEPVQETDQPKSADSAEPVTAAENSQADERTTLEELRAELQELKTKIPSPDHLVEQVVKHPSLKQRQRDMIAHQLQLQLQEEIQRRTEAIETLEEEGQLDPTVAKKMKREIASQIRQEFAQKQQEALSAVDSGESSGGVPGSIWKQLGYSLLKTLELTPEDLPELKATTAIPFDKLAELAAQAKVKKVLNQKKLEWQKEWEAERAAVLEKEKRGAVAPTPDATKPKKKEEKNPLDGITDSRTLYRLAADGLRKKAG